MPTRRDLLRATLTWPVATGIAGAASRQPVAQDTSPAPARHSTFDPWVELHAGHLRHNVTEIRRRVGGRPILAVIKNNGYGAGVVDVGGSAKPAVTVSNSGTAHGRLTGFLSGTDANGRTLDFTPSSLPILPGESRTLTFDASDGSTVVSAIAYPVRIRGAIEWGNGMRTEFDHLYAR